MDAALALVMVCTTAGSQSVKRELDPEAKPKTADGTDPGAKQLSIGDTFLPRPASEAWETNASVAIGVQQVTLCSCTEISCVMFPTTAEKEGMHKLDSLASQETEHPTPMG